MMAPIAGDGRVGQILGNLRTRNALDLTKDIAKSHGVEMRELLSRTRTQHVVRARHSVWRELHSRGWAFIEIGRVFLMDHTTVMHAVKGVGR